MDSRFDFVESISALTTLWNTHQIANPDIVRNYSYSALARVERITQPKSKHTEQAGDVTPDTSRYVLVLPPPNLTGILHMGHGLNSTVQDTIVRYNRMCGKKTLWLPGTDHAGIATQQKVEAELKSKGKTKEDLGRTAFWEYTRQFAEKNRDTILTQFDTLGSSFDTSRYSFTLDKERAHAVFYTFKVLFERGLIYKGNYLVNWSPGAGTALSDDEVEYKEVQGALYYINYQLIPPPSATAQSDDKALSHIQIATTRPETLLGDTAVAVHPEDPRYASLVSQGYRLKVPLCERLIPLIADARVSKEFGTGAVKVTPSHDKNDYELGISHKLQFINVIGTDARMIGDIPEDYRGLSVEDARSKIVEDLKNEGALSHTKAHIHQVGHCHRTGTQVQFLLSEQWYVSMRGMAQKALDAWKNGEIVFYPQSWEKTFAHWLTNVRDWCISRQLWWGHRIPVWYHSVTGESIVSEHNPSTDKDTYTQDTNVLDTWFSSWLWPMSTTGWPDITKDFAHYYPGTSLITAYDIIFFWVARMIMAGIELTGKVPFKHVYLHGLVRDSQGRKMSKSLGNGIDPMELIHEIGPDALRFTLVYLCAQGRDVLISKDTFSLGSKFITKIWNASRFVIQGCEAIFQNEKEAQAFTRIYELASNISESKAASFDAVGTSATGGSSNPSNSDPSTPESGGHDSNSSKKTDVNESLENLKSIDKWLLFKLRSCERDVAQAMAQYRVDEAAHAVYKFFWNDFCDWYIELTKFYIHPSQSNSDDADRLSQLSRDAMYLLTMLVQSLRLLHPFVPFVTEKIYQILQERYPSEQLWSSDQSEPTDQSRPSDKSRPTDQSEPTDQLRPVEHPRILAVEAYPNLESYDLDSDNEYLAEISQLQELVSEVRRIRSELQLPKKLKLGLQFVELAPHAHIYKQQKLIEFLCLVEFIDDPFASNNSSASNNSPAIGENKTQSIKIVGSFFEARLFLASDEYDLSAQTTLMKAKLDKLSSQHKGLSAQLSNTEFTSKAKPEYITQIQAQHSTLQETISKLSAIIKSIE